MLLANDRNYLVITEKKGRTVVGKNEKYLIPGEPFSRYLTQVTLRAGSFVHNITVQLQTAITAMLMAGGNQKVHCDVQPISPLGSTE